MVPSLQEYYLEEASPYTGEISAKEIKAVLGSVRGLRSGDSGFGGWGSGLKTSYSNEHVL